MHLNSYSTFKARLNKLPRRAKIAIVESIKISKSSRSILKEYVISKERHQRLLREGWRNKSEELTGSIDGQASADKQRMSKLLTLSLNGAGYDDKMVYKFVDYLLKGNYKEFIENINKGDNLAKEFETVDTSKPNYGASFSQGSREPGKKSRNNYTPVDRRPQPEGHGLGDGMGDNEEFFDDKPDYSKLKNQKLVRSPSVGERAKSAASSVGKAASKAGDAVAKTAKSVGKGAVNAGKAVGKNVAKAGSAVGRGASKLAGGVKNKLKNVVKTAKDKMEPAWKKSLKEAIENKDYKKLRLLKEQLRKEIIKQLLIENRKK